MKKTILISISVLVSAIAVLAQTTIVENVTVPVEFLRNYKSVMENGNETYYYTGKILYDFQEGENDSFDVSLSIAPVGGGEEVALIDADGDVGEIHQNGQKSFFFRCKVVGQPAAGYEATITVEANKSVVEQKIDSLISLMALEEKCLQLYGPNDRTTNDLTRLNIMGFRMVNGPHGAGIFGGTEADPQSTLFPTLCAVACTFDTALVESLGMAIGRECRAIGKNVNLGPMINIVVHPRAGRNFETYSEDPYLTERLAIAQVKGIQSVGVISTPKHYLCNNRENRRFYYSSDISERAMRELFMPAYRGCITEGKAWSIMSAYNAVNEEFCGFSQHLLNDIVKGEWGFKGFLMPDFGATEWNEGWNLSSLSGSMQKAALAANSGCDIDMPSGAIYQSLASAVSRGSVNESVVDDMVRRTLRAKFFAGQFEEQYTPGKYINHGTYPTGYDSYFASEEHRLLALKAARECIVLAKNEIDPQTNTPLLPLDKTGSIRIAVVGPWATIARWGGGGTSEVEPVTGSDISPYDGLLNRTQGTNVQINEDYNNCDYAVVVVGVWDESEEWDKDNFKVPSSDNSLVANVMAAKPNRTIVVFTGGSACHSGEWSDAPAVIIALYPGQEQGNALADIIFGDVNPSGRVAVTFPDNNDQLDGTSSIFKPVFSKLPENDRVIYASADTGHGYFFFDKTEQEPLFWFGHGLSYTTFEYSSMQILPEAINAGDRVTVIFTLGNTGDRSGEEVVQLYVKWPQDGDVPRRVKDLRQFRRVHLEPNEKKTVEFTLTERDFAYYSETEGGWVVEPNTYEIVIGPTSESSVLEQRGVTGIVTIN